ncbi:MAG: plasmid pRiA4b ORF-3 family protein [Fibrobacteres bacterium]|nr:plasmid pRiA4b ORF-3 family protein [Fibrobacterota bacterium]
MDKIALFKVSIDGIEPLIWRRFAIPLSETFETFHKTIQKFMGWKNYHLFEFKVPSLSGYVKIGSPDPEEPPSIRNLPEKKVKISDYMFKVNDRAKYIYDFGDNWEHTIQLESFINKEADKKYPMLIDGARACPPEDCGGVWGYENLVKALSDPEHPEHKEIREWVGEKFDPVKFDYISISLKKEIS